MGFLSFWGLFWLVRRVFSGSGFFWFLASSCLLAVWSWGVGGRVVGGFLGFGVGCARFFSFFLLGWVGCSWRARFLRFCAGVGCVCAWFLTSLCFGGVGVGCVCAWFLLPVGVGVGCAWFPGSCSRCFLVVFAEGFPGVFVSARRFLPLVWGVSGWVGVVFLRLFCSARAWFGFGFGFVWRV